jgi:hypothetical protein
MHNSKLTKFSLKGFTHRDGLRRFGGVARIQLATMLRRIESGELMDGWRNAVAGPATIGPVPLAEPTKARKTGAK